MEDDSRSDSGVSTLRSDGARSSGDERSGSRSSAISDDRYKSIILHQGCIFFLNILPLKNVFEPFFFITESGAYEGRGALSILHLLAFPFLRQSTFYVALQVIE